MLGRGILAVAVVSAGWLVLPATAVAQSSQQERLLIFYNYYTQQQANRQMALRQRQLSNELSQFQQQQQRYNQDFRTERLTTVPGQDRRRSRRSVSRDPGRVPSLYRRTGGQRNYFLQIDYFNPTQRF